MESSIFWDIMQRGPVEVNQSFGGKYRLLLQNRGVKQAINSALFAASFMLVSCLDYSSTLKMEMICSSEHSVGFISQKIYLFTDQDVLKFELEIARCLSENIFYLRLGSNSAPLLGWACINCTRIAIDRTVARSHSASAVVPSQTFILKYCIYSLCLCCPITFRCSPGSASVERKEYWGESKTVVSNIDS
jgi:hypothetical protein